MKPYLFLVKFTFHVACLSSRIINFIAGTDPHWFHHFKEIDQTFCYKYIFIRKNFPGKFGQMCFFF